MVTPLLMSPLHPDIKHNLILEKIIIIILTITLVLPLWTIGYLLYLAKRLDLSIESHKFLDTSLSVRVWVLPPRMESRLHKSLLVELTADRGTLLISGVGACWFCVLCFTAPNCGMEFILWTVPSWKDLVLGSFLNVGVCDFDGWCIYSFSSSCSSSLGKDDFIDDGWSVRVGSVKDGLVRWWMRNLGYL